MHRPPPVEVGDDAVVRRDLDSDDMRRVHPEVGRARSGWARHVLRCDAVAYLSIRDRFPDFRPPHACLISETDPDPPAAI